MITITSYNIRDRRNGGLQSAARPLGKEEVNIAVVQEVKITDPQYANKDSNRYEIWTAALVSQNCGGVALIVQENDRYNFTVENEKTVGPNNVSYKMVCGRGGEEAVHCRMLPAAVRHNGDDSTDDLGCHPGPPPGENMNAKLDFLGIDRRGSWR